MANSVYPDETARQEPSHLDLHCLYRYLFWSAELKGSKHMRTVHRLCECANGSWGVGVCVWGGGLCCTHNVVTLSIGTDRPEYTD